MCCGYNIFLLYLIEIDFKYLIHFALPTLPPVNNKINMDLAECLLITQTISNLLENNYNT